MWDDATRDDDVPDGEARGVRRTEHPGRDPARLLGEPAVALLSRLALVDRLLLEDRLTWLVESSAAAAPGAQVAPLHTPLLPRSVRDPAHLVELVDRLPPEARETAVAACLEVLAGPRVRRRNPYRQAPAGLSRHRLVAVLPAVLGTAGIASLLGVPPPRLSVAVLTAVPLVTAAATVVIALGRRPTPEDGAAPAPRRTGRRWRQSPG